MRFKGAAVVFTAVITMLLTSVPASAAANVLTVSDTTPGRGQLVLLTGSGCVANSRVSGRFAGEALRHSTADNEGDFSFTIRIPFTATNGIHHVGSRCPRAYPLGSNLNLSKAVRVHEGITLSRTRIARGRSVTVRGRGCDPNETVVFKLDSTTLRRGPAGSTGAFSKGVIIPRRARLGFALLRAICGDLDQSERVRITRV